MTLRRFEAADADVLRRLRYPDMPAEAVREMIDGWNTLSYQGRYFEMLAVLRGGELVGTVSLYQHSDSAVSIGPEIFPACRRKGFGGAAMRLALGLAKNRGFKIVLQQVRSDNAASIALHESLGFETDRYGYLNRKGQEVFLFYQALF